MVSHSIVLYIHVPFCIRKCNYCSFVSYRYSEADIPAYFGALEKELSWRANGERVRSMYFGGGTPSLLSDEYIGGVLSTIKSSFTVDEPAEITIEANPGTVNMAYLKALRKLGVNRLSLGVQSMNDSELELLGRIHTATEARDAANLARSSGFANLSLDLIYGLPRQTLQDWQNTLDEVIAMKPAHLSLYALSLEPETKMWESIKEKSIPDIDPDVSADQYEYAEDLLSAHDYRHYEISNWARQGMECRHNIAYWQNLPYLGVGVAAHSHLNGHRLANTSSINKYLAAFSDNLLPAPELDEELSPELQLAETVILGLRLCEGIPVDDFNRRFGIDILELYKQQIKELVELDLLECIDGRILLTRRGRLLSNEAFLRFLPG
ncbi:radical SAM family heme chaperone HemW [Chloroflexota bacterium]